MKFVDSEYEQELEMAYRTILQSGTVILPTNIGYTMVTLLSKETSNNLNSIRGTSHDMTHTLIGSESTYRLIFDCEPPNMSSFGQITDDLSISFVRRHSRNICPDFLRRLQDGNVINSVGECTFAMNLGPVCGYLFQRFQSDDNDQILIGVHCDAKPKAKTYTLDAVHPELKSKVDFILDIPHWSKPQFDDMGRWLSSPVFDLEELRFCRLGKNMPIAAVVISIFTLSLFTSIDIEEKGVISWDEFKLYYSKFENSERDQMVKNKLRTVFKSIDRDGSGSIDINELYEHILHSADTHNAFVFGGDSSTILMVAPPSFDEGDVKYHLQSENDDEETQKNNAFSMHTQRKTGDVQRQRKIIGEVVKKNESSIDGKKKASFEKTSSSSDIRIQNVFNNLYRLSFDRQKEGKALRHAAQCTLMKRAAERNGGQHTFNKLTYHSNQNDVSDEKENMPHPKISLARAEELYERLVQHKKKVEDKTAALRRALQERSI